MTIVLLYHDVAPSEMREETGFKGPLAARYKLEPSDFAAHLDAIAATNRVVGTFASADDQPAVALTFDDGGASALDAASAVEEHGWRAHFFVVTSLIDEPGFLRRTDILELVRRGHGIGSHSHTHPTYMARLSRRELEHEWSISRGILEDILGTAPSTASVPGGMSSRAVAESAARAGYTMLMTSEPVTRHGWTNGLVTVGRFNIWSTTPAAQAAAYACGARGPRARLWLEWQAKSATKRVSPSLYQRIRRLRAGKS